MNNREREFLSAVMALSNLGPIIEKLLPLGASSPPAEKVIPPLPPYPDFETLRRIELGPAFDMPFMPRENGAERANPNQPWYARHYREKRRNR